MRQLIELYFIYKIYFYQNYRISFTILNYFEFIYQTKFIKKEVKITRIRINIIKYGTFNDRFFKGTKRGFYNNKDE